MVTPASSTDVDNSTTQIPTPTSPTTTPMTQQLMNEIEAASQNLITETAASTSRDNSSSNSSKTSRQSTRSPNNRNKKTVHFKQVNVLLFQRCPGVSSVPSNDDDAQPRKTVTLGMSFRHDQEETFPTIDEHLKFKRKCDLDKMEKFYLANSSSSELMTTKRENEDDNEEEEDDEECELRIKLDKARSILENKSYYESNIECDLDLHPDVVCPILSNDERIEKLLECGYDVDQHLNQAHDDQETHNDDLSQIKVSRQVCGCVCKGVCGQNDSCSCFANGINCQIDRWNYPCSCSQKRCKNPFGLKKFNLKSVMEHSKSVLSKKSILIDQDEEENKQQEPSSGATTKTEGGVGKGKRKRASSAVSGKRKNKKRRASS
jgi:hypothetical protein